MPVGFPVYSSRTAEDDSEGSWHDDVNMWIEDHQAQGVAGIADTGGGINAGRGFQNPWEALHSLSTDQGLAAGRFYFQVRLIVLNDYCTNMKPVSI